MSTKKVAETWNLDHLSCWDQPKILTCITEKHKQFITEIIWIENCDNQTYNYSTFINQFDYNIDAVMKIMDKQVFLHNDFLEVMTLQDNKRVLDKHQTKILEYIFQDHSVQNYQSLFQIKIAKIFLKIQDPTLLITYILNNKKETQMDLLNDLLQRWIRVNKINNKYLCQDDLLWYSEFFNYFTHDYIKKFEYWISLIRYTNINDYEKIINQIVSLMPSNQLIKKTNWFNNLHSPFRDFPEQFKQQLANTLFSKNQYYMLFTIYESLWIDLNNLLLSMTCNGDDYWKYIYKKLDSTDINYFLLMMRDIEDFKFDWANFWNFCDEINPIVERFQFKKIKISDDFLKKIRDIKERFIFLQNVSNEIDEETEFDDLSMGFIPRSDRRFRNNEDEKKYYRLEKEFNEKVCRLWRSKLSGKNIPLIR